MSSASGLLAQADAKRALAKQLRFTAAGLSILADRKLIMFHADCLDREAAQLEERERVWPNLGSDVLRVGLQS
jgi:hypothetical protein